MLQTYKGMAFKAYPDYAGTSLCLAGLEAREFANVFIEMNVKSVLASFFYLRRKFKRTKDYIKELKEQYENFDYIFMDSGGFSLNDQKIRGKMKMSLKDYIKYYKDFALEMQEHVTVFGAIDCIDDKYTYEDYAEHLYDFKNAGIHIAPTIFINTDWKFIKKYKITENFDIVGLSGARFSFQKLLMQYIKLRRTGVKIHGFAATKVEHFTKIKFFSVDSISWLSAQRHGLTFEFRNGKMRTHSPYMKNEYRRYLSGIYGNEYNIDRNAIMQESELRKRKQSVSQDIYDEGNKLNLVAWVKLAEQERHNSFRAYWNDEDNVKNLEYDFID